MTFRTRAQLTPLALYNSLQAIWSRTIGCSPIDCSKLTILPRTMSLAGVSAGGGGRAPGAKPQGGGASLGPELCPRVFSPNGGRAVKPRFGRHAPGQPHHRTGR